LCRIFVRPQGVEMGAYPSSVTIFAPQQADKNSPGANFRVSPEGVRRKDAPNNKDQQGVQVVLNSRITAQVQERHRSREFVDFLKELDSYYPPGALLRIVLDNHSAHISQETSAYLDTVPGRFVYVHTPKHGSWLNLIGSVFSKMSRTFLRHIRVGSKEELKQRILKGIAEMNQDPVIFRWRNFDAISV
jgi:transposase